MSYASPLRASPPLNPAGGSTNSDTADRQLQSRTPAAREKAVHKRMADELSRRAVLYEKEDSKRGEHDTAKTPKVGNTTARCRARQEAKRRQRKQRSIQFAESGPRAYLAITSKHRIFPFRQLPVSFPFWLPASLWLRSSCRMCRLHCISDYTP